MDVNPANIKPPDLQMTDPVLRYRLDPLEPGLLRSARASQSTAAVSAHELGNLIEFRREAAQTGRMVVYSSITFKRGIDGSYPSIRAGRTEVVSVPLPEPYAPETANPAVRYPASEPVIEDNPDGNIVFHKELELLASLASIQNRIKMENAPVQDPSTEIDFSAELTNLKVEFTADEIDTPTDGEGEIQAPSLPGASATEEAVILNDEIKSHTPKIKTPQITPADRHYRQEMNRLKAQLNEIRMRKLRANIDRLNEVLSHVISTNISILSRLVKVANRMGPGSHFPDESLEIPMPGVYLDYLV